MSDHNFSNQKSALEDYFESLLEETDESKQLAADVKAEPQTKADHSLKDEHVVETGSSEKAAGVQVENSQVSARTSVADMLADIETRTLAEPDTQKEFAEPEAVAEILIPIPEVVQQVELETETVEEVVEVVTEPEIAEVVVVEEQVAVAQTPELVQEISGPPEWAESKFQCLLFNVGGLSLAVPLIKLNGVISWSDKIVETPNQTDWYLGVLMNLGKKVEVIDTAVMVLPAEHRKEMAVEPAERLSHILLVDDQKWGLACDSIGEVVWLNKEDVKWRSNKTKRPWLLGTAIEHMCAVMDTEAFAEMLGHNK
jgi:purine-binding chemotaxis protein CheW